MRGRFAILPAVLLVPGALFCLPACSTPPLSPPIPLSQSAVDAFVASAHDPREMNITPYLSAPGGPRFDFANRPHPERRADVPFAFPPSSPFADLPAIPAKSGRESPFTLLVDSSARQSWLNLAACPAMDYRPFKCPVDPVGEFPDHVPSPVPGYAGVANKVIFGTLHLESPVFYVPMSSGNLGNLSRIFPDPDAPDPVPQKIRSRSVNSIHAVLGAAALHAFSSVRFDFPRRSLRFSTASKPYAPDKNRLLASLPLRSWKGRPAVEISLGGAPLLAVLDTAGRFALSLPAPRSPAPLRIGPISLPDIPISSHAENLLPEDFPPRIGLGVLSSYVIVLDQAQSRLWIESPEPLAPAPGESLSDASAEPAHVRYKGVIR